MTETSPGPPGHRPTWAEIDLEALASNFQEVRRRVGPRVGIMAMVKADAYGHGAADCARRLAAAGAEWFGVALPEEGIELRQAGISQPILCLGGFWPGQEAACLDHRLVPVLYRIDVAEALDRAAAARGVVADAHVKIDTGMGRLGMRFEHTAEFAAALSRLRHVRVDGLMTHFAAADDPRLDEFTNEQEAHFKEALEIFRHHGHRPTCEHTSNSAAIFGHPDAAHNLVRPGGALYGLWRDVLPPLAAPPALRPVMSLRSRITLLKRVRKGETLGYGCTFKASRDMLAATLPVGYHDGYLRCLSNRGRVVVRGALAPVVGRVSMDFTIVDVTDIPGVAPDDVVTLIGTDGEGAVTAEEIAKQAGTISYEVTCGISRRVPRICTRSPV